ncbi:Bidirectional sugar transporter SWEET10-like protein [Dioscorea alata]|uniref:Bidirectional sugar transporter SWEET10-like protein n=1 Tax=Dioscorea alata TaxID=55571 RepID=A0ACB7UTL9_DIOAL|nr:Bidirectional sugar transporter SWEET10-like protein [Dioscorea alata]
MCLLIYRRAFYGVYNREGAIEELTPVPYIISLFNCMLRTYYASINGSGYIVFLIISIFGCFFNVIYIIVYLIIYTPKKIKMYTGILIMILDVGLFSLILLLTLLLWRGEEGIHVLSWIYLICLIITSAVSPLSTICHVIKTRSIKCMPFYDPLLTTVGATSWLAYGILMKNVNIAVPNALSLMFGVIQIVIYMIMCKRAASVKDVDSLRLPEGHSGAGEVKKLKVCGPLENFGLFAEENREEAAESFHFITFSDIA